MYPSGWPTCRPAPDGYGNMSCTCSLAAPARGWVGSASSPTGLGAWKVPCCDQYSCQRGSISLAIAAVYRNRGISDSLIVTISSTSEGPRGLLGGMNRGIKKPLAQEGA